jgi:RTX calcium-binding nonapeptide repeat (4 copies)
VTAVEQSASATTVKATVGDRGFNAARPLHIRPRRRPRGRNDSPCLTAEVRGVSWSGAAASVIRGGPDNDRLKGGSGPNLIRGGRGNNRIRAGAGNDRSYGGPGNDRIHGGRGNDFLYGGAGTDLLYGGLGKDRMSTTGAPRPCSRSQETTWSTSTMAGATIGWCARPARSPMSLPTGAIGSRAAASNVLPKRRRRGSGVLSNSAR